MLVSYNWLKDYLGKDVPSPEMLADLLSAHTFEIESIEVVEDDTVIDVSVLPNRSSDCLSIRGIARELATLLDRELINDPLTAAPMERATDAIRITIENKEDCPRFTLSLMEGITVEPSPSWLQARLASLGVRSINNIVDATNYVMYATGQPTHVYDADKFPKNADGTYGVVIRRANAGETVALLAEGGKDAERVLELQGGELLVVNEAEDVAVGLAGVKGGRFAEVTKETRNVLIEAAHFNPTLTRQTARRNNIVIDASKRFENEPSRMLPGYAQTALIELIASIAGGTYQGTVDEFPAPVTNPTVSVRPEKANALLGYESSVAEMKAVLERAGITVTGDTVLQCTGPFERTDLNLEVDFIEEIGRIQGYDRVPTVLPEKVTLAEVNQRHYYSELVRRTLLGLGFSEVITSSFAKKDLICLQNALASDKGCIRSSLIKNITDVLDKNAGFTDLLGATDTRVFEIGTVFSPENGAIEEHTSLALGVRLRPSGYSGKEDSALKEILTALDTALGTSVVWKIEKGVAEANFDAVVATLVPAKEYAPQQVADTDVIYQAFSVYPAVTRDIAMWVPAGIEAKEIEAVLRQHAGPLCVRITHVDEFQKDGRMSQAFRLVFQSKEKTLTDSEIHDVMNIIYPAVSEREWEVR